jgi:hypothetical protein
MNGEDIAILQSLGPRSSAEELFGMEYLLDREGLDLIDRLTLQPSLMNDPEVKDQAGRQLVNAYRVLGNLWSMFPLAHGVQTSEKAKVYIDRLARKNSAFQMIAEEPARYRPEVLIPVVREIAGLKKRKTAHRRGKKIWICLD